VRGRTRACAIVLTASLALLWMGCATGKGSAAKQVEAGGAETMSKSGSGDNAPAGLWEGHFEFRGQRVGMSVDFDAGALSIPQQGLTDHPIQGFAYDPPRLSFVLPVGGGVEFQGELTDDASGRRIAGTFRQAGAEGTFQLAPADRVRSGEAEAAPTGKSRPAGLTVRSEESALDTGSGTLFGTLTLPEGEGPTPVVLIVAGSGPTDRDGNSPLFPGKNDSLKLLAEGLAGYGIAALRYDKRGIAASRAAGADEGEVDFEVFIQDAAAWVARLERDPRFSSVGVVGHSEGSLIGMVAAGRAGTDAYVSIAGAGKPLYQTILDQLRARAPELVADATEIMTTLRRGQAVAEVRPELESLFRPSVQPFLISLFRYDPGVEISRLEIPVLIVNGSHDLQASVEEAHLLAAARPEAGLRIIEGVNHVLKRAPADPQGNFATYGDPSLPLDQELLEAVGGFLRATLRTDNPG